MKSYCIPACSGPGQGDGGLDPGSNSKNEKCSESLCVSQIILARLADSQEVKGTESVLIWGACSAVDIHFLLPSVKSMLASEFPNPGKCSSSSDDDNLQDSRDRAEERVGVSMGRLASLVSAPWSPDTRTLLAERLMEIKACVCILLSQSLSPPCHFQRDFRVILGTFRGSRALALAGSYGAAQREVSLKASSPVYCFCERGLLSWAPGSGLPFSDPSHFQVLCAES